MNIKFNCPSCDTHIVIDGAGAGMSVQCPNCGQSLTVPPSSAANSSGTVTAREKLEAEIRAMGIEKPSVNDVIRAATKLFSNDESVSVPKAAPRIGWVRVSGCRSVKVPVNLDAHCETPKTFEDYLSQFSDSEQKEAFGEAPLRAYRRGEITPAQLIGQEDCVMKLKLLLENS